MLRKKNVTSWIVSQDATHFFESNNAPKTADLIRRHYDRLEAPEHVFVHAISECKSTDFVIKLITVADPELLFCLVAFKWLSQGKRIEPFESNLWSTVQRMHAQYRRRLNRSMQRYLSADIGLAITAIGTHADRELLEAALRIGQHCLTYAQGTRLERKLRVPVVVAA